jgi:hypothetical protein
VKLLEDGRYELRGPSGLVSGFRKALVEEFRAQGFERTLKVDVPSGPQVNEFARDKKLVTVSLESKGGGEQLLAVETEAEFPELEDVIVCGVARFLLDCAVVLFASFDDAQTREALERLERSFGKGLKKIAPEV